MVVSILVTWPAVANDGFAWRVPLAPERTEYEVRATDAAELLLRFQKLGYDLATVRGSVAEVPRVVVPSLPHDLMLRSVEERKSLFILTMLPLVLQVNEAVLRDRARLLAISARPESERATWEQAWLLELADRYGSPPGNFDELLRRVDVVPASLALAQAAEESGWGTSRFAREGNAVFGQWTYTANAGILPSSRPDGATHYVRAFEGLPASVAGYLHNLNTHVAYAAFRNRRAFLRAHVGELDALGLANTLRHYSARRQAYVAAIRDIIEANRLTMYDGAELRRGTGEAVPRL